MHSYHSSHMAFNAGRSFLEHSFSWYSDRHSAILLSISRRAASLAVRISERTVSKIDQQKNTKADTMMQLTRSWIQRYRFSGAFGCSSKVWKRLLTQLRPFFFLLPLPRADVERDPSPAESYSESPQSCEPWYRTLPTSLSRLCRFRFLMAGYSRPPLGISPFPGAWRFDD